MAQGLRRNGLPDRRRRPGQLRGAQGPRRRVHRGADGAAVRARLRVPRPVREQVPARQADRWLIRPGAAGESPPGALRADQRERLLLGDRDGCDHPSPGPAGLAGRAASPRRGDARLAERPNPACRETTTSTRLPSGEPSPTVSASAPATETATGRSPSSTPGARGAWAAAPRAGHRARRSRRDRRVRRPAERVGRTTSAPGGTKLDGTRRTAKPGPACLGTDRLSGRRARRSQPPRLQRPVAGLDSRAVAGRHRRGQSSADESGDEEDERPGTAAHAASA